MIDSGGLISIFTLSVAKRLGIKNIKSGKLDYLTGVSGRIPIYIHKILFEFAGKKFICRVAFSDKYEPSFNIIGQMDFFDNFLVIFNKRKNRFSIK